DVLVTQTISLLRTPSPTLRKSAALVLGRLQSDRVTRFRVLESLVGSFRDSSEEVRSAAAEALSNLSSQGHKTNVYQVLTQAAEARDHLTKACALRTMPHICDGENLQQFEPQFTAALNASNLEVRIEGAVALGLCEGTNNKETLIRRLLRMTDSGHSRLRASAVRSIGLLASKSVEEEAYRAVRKCLTDRDDNVKTAAADAVSQFGRNGDRFADELIALLAEDPESGFATFLLETSRLLSRKLRGRSVEEDLLRLSPASKMRTWQAASSALKNIELRDVDDTLERLTGLLRPVKQWTFLKSPYVIDAIAGIGLRERSARALECIFAITKDLSESADGIYLPYDFVQSS